MNSNLDISFTPSDVGVSYLSIILVRYVVFIFSSESVKTCLWFTLDGSPLFIILESGKPYHSTFDTVIEKSSLYSILSLSSKL